jgi:hypothetical protein
MLRRYGLRINPLLSYRVAESVSKYAVKAAAQKGEPAAEYSDG